MEDQWIPVINVSGEKEGELMISISGHVTLENLETVSGELRARLADMLPTTLAVDLAGVDYLDSAGALALVQLGTDATGRAIPLRFVNVAPQAERIIGLV